jgi:FlaA1/EpsC-like NDP-sugar epimerase
VIAADVLIVFAAYLGALFLRFGGAVPARHWSSAVVIVSSVAVGHVVVNYLFGAYSNDSTVRRVTFAGLVIGVLVLTVSLSLDYSRLPLSVVVFGSLVSLLGFIVVRMATRGWGRGGGGAQARGTMLS